MARAGFFSLSRDPQRLADVELHRGAQMLWPGWHNGAQVEERSGPILQGQQGVVS